MLNYQRVIYQFAMANDVSITGYCRLSSLNRYSTLVIFGLLLTNHVSSLSSIAPPVTQGEWLVSQWQRLKGAACHGHSWLRHALRALNLTLSWLHQLMPLAAMRRDD